ncbi:MAG: hypothetical protein H7338_22455 [Candidatus Sericytochromatia bacterium]|nr:hypothetical protein [Candidatus Sericytochromatia bacterium]
MFANPKTWRAARLTVLISLLAGCGAIGHGSSMATGPQPERVYTVQEMPGNQIQQPMPQGQQAPAIGQRMPQQDSELNFSQEQQKQLQAIMQKFVPKGTANEIKQRAQQLQQILSAPQVDVQALATHIGKDRQQLQAHVQDIVNALAEMRQVLTVEQRVTFAKLIQSQQADTSDDSLQGLNLSQQQQQALAAIGPQAMHAALAPAIQQFLPSGDKQALQTAIQQGFAQLPQPQMVASVIAGLSQDQRQKLLQMGDDEPQIGQQTGMQQGQPQSGL